MGPICWWGAKLFRVRPTTKINASQTVPTRLQAIIPQGSGRNTGNSSKVKTQQPRGTLVLTSILNSTAKHYSNTKPANFSITDRVFIIPNRLLPNWPCDGWMLCPGWGRENSRGFFHGFMGPYFMGISYSVVQVIFKAASHPLIPLSSPHLTIGWKRFS